MGGYTPAGLTAMMSGFQSGIAQRRQADLDALRAQFRMQEMIQGTIPHARFQPSAYWVATPHREPKPCEGCGAVADGARCDYCKRPR